MTDQVNNIVGELDPTKKKCTKCNKYYDELEFIIQQQDNLIVSPHIIVVTTTCNECRKRKIESWNPPIYL